MNSTSAHRSVKMNYVGSIVNKNLPFTNKQPTFIPMAKYLILVGSSCAFALASFISTDADIEIRDRHATCISTADFTISLQYADDLTLAVADTQDFKFESPLVGFIRFPEEIASPTNKSEVSVARGPPKSLKSRSHDRVKS